MSKKLIYSVFSSLIISMVFVTVAQSADPTLVGWWKLDDGSGDVAIDSSGQGKDGSLQGDPVWLPTGGKLNGALEFDGSEDQVTVDEAGDFGITNTMSVAAWMNIPEVGRSFEYAWGYDSYDTPRLMRAGTGTTFKFCGGGITGDAATADLGGAGWHHVVAVADGTNYILYVDGSLGGQAPYSGDIITYNNWCIGNAYGDDDRRFIGALDDVRVYNRALTQEEIRLIMDGELPAKVPYPAEEAKDVPRDVILGWIPGELAETHDVYFGKVVEDVNNASTTNPLDVLVSLGQVANTYDPDGLLEFGKTYYWRIDEVGAAPDYATTTGRLWQFTAEPFAYEVLSQNITATASGSNSADEGPVNTINGYGLDVNDLHSAGNADMWLSSLTGPQPTWIEYEFDRVYKLNQMWVWNHNSLSEQGFGLGIKDATIEYSVDGVNWTTLGATHEFTRAPGAADYESNTTVELNGAAAKYVKITPISNWGGIVTQYGLSEVRFSYIYVQAREPNPDIGAMDVSIGTLDEPIDVTLSFRAGRDAVEHDVYFSTDEQAVIDGTAPVTAVTETSYGPVLLDLGETYYWRIDEVNDAGTPTMWQGSVWNFTTQEYFVVDNFEDYNDFEPDRVFDAWIDGWDIQANGSTAGHSDPDFGNGEHFAETLIVHSGKQSLPFLYDNSVGYSEATMSLVTGRDWTIRGAGVLSLWFMGDSANTAERMYVALNGNAVVHNDDPNVAQTDTWTEWNIDLQAFADQGVDLTNVNTITLGFGDKVNPVAGGSGMMYYDDIRLTKTAVPVAPVTPVTPVTDPNLVGWWKLDDGSGDVAIDSSGQGKDGSLQGDPVWLPTGGKLNGALEFDGSEDQVTVDEAGDFGITNTMSVAAWMNIPEVGRSFEYAWGYDSYDTPRLMRAGTGTTFKFCGGGITGDAATADLGAAGWHHVVAVADGASYILYVDGLLGAQAPYSGDIITYNNWCIGNAYGDDARRFIGALDDVRVYNRALTQEEIQLIMDGQL